MICLYGCQQELIPNTKELTPVLEYLCSEINDLTNCGIYYARQIYFKTGRILSGKAGSAGLCKEMKSSLHYGAVYSQVAQQALNGIAESFKSFQELISSYKKGELENKPRPPKYRKSNGMAIATYPKQALKLIGKQVRLPMGQLCKTWFGVEAFWLTMPSNLRFEDIKEVRVLPRNRCFYAEWVYLQKTISVELDPSRVLGIDSGVTNWLTCVSNVDTSFIIDGRHVKSLNQWFNKSVAKIKEGKPQGFWSKRLAHLTEKRNRQMRDAINKAARIVINHCLERKIGRIVFGWNQGIKQEINIGKRNNQAFVQIPTAKLKCRIAQLCKQYGIQFVETEEANTSAASFLDGDTVPKYGEKPTDWKSSGKRVKRGLFRRSEQLLCQRRC